MKVSFDLGVDLALLNSFKAMFSCVIPSTLISGGMGQRIEFPQWLGKNSKYGRMDRMLQELKGHMRLR